MKTYVRVSWKGWKRSRSYELLARLCNTGTTKHRHGSDRMRIVYNEHKACVVAKVCHFEH